VSSESNIHVVRARYLDAHRVWLRFEDGLEGEIDLGRQLEGEIFEPLNDPGYFSRFKVDGTLTWANGADFAPEFLHDLLTKKRRSGAA
jgi:hypothetical protein